MENTVTLNEANWEEEVGKADALTVVYFWHEQCPWCKKFSPLFKELSAEYNGRARFAKLNMLETQGNQEIAKNLGVMSTPTLMFFCAGRPITQIAGLRAMEDLTRMLEELLGKYKKCLQQSTDLRNYIV